MVIRVKASKPAENLSSGKPAEKSESASHYFSGQIFRQFHKNEGDKLLEQDCYTHSRFYGTLLNKYPGLHQHIKTGYSEEECLDLATTLEDFIDELAPTEMECFQKFLEDYTKNLRRAAENRIADESDFLIPLQKRVADIHRLRPGESYLIAGGWKNHAVMYEILRPESGPGFILTIMNTGDDDYKPKNRLNKGETLESTEGRYRHKGYYIPKVSTDLLEVLKKSQEQTGDETITKIEDICLGVLKGTDHNGRLHYDQKRGNCAQKSQTSCFKGACIREFGELEGNLLYERIRLYRSYRQVGLIDKIDREASKAKLKKVYAVKNDQELHDAIQDRKLAAQKVIEVREAKLDHLEEKKSSIEHIKRKIGQEEGIRGEFGVFYANLIHETQLKNLWSIEGEEPKIDSCIQNFPSQAIPLYEALRKNGWDLNEGTKAEVQRFIEISPEFGVPIFEASRKNGWDLTRETIEKLAKLLEKTPEHGIEIYQKMLEEKRKSRG